MKLFVEGGGDATALKTACREGFQKFVTAAGVKSRPRIVACGSRRNAYEDYCEAVRQGEPAMLLVDSESAVAAHHQEGEDACAWQPWAHLKQRQGDGWSKPAGVPDTDCHLMVQCMESWFLADRNTLATFFGQGFKPAQLPASAHAVETVAKTVVYDALHRATKECKTKSSYGKGDHSFKILGLIKPDLVAAASPWARRFIDELKKRMSAG